MSVPTVQDSSSVYINFIDTQGTTFNSLIQLKSAEDSMIDKLNSGNLDPATKTAILNVVNQLSTMRQDLYKSLYDIKGYSFSSDSSNNTNITKINDFINKVVTDKRAEVDQLIDANNNTTRSAEINMYYNQNNKAYLNMMITLVICLAIIFCIQLVSYSLGLPSTFFNVISVVIFILGFMMVNRQYRDIHARDNTYFDKYDHPSPAPSSSGGNLALSLNTAATAPSSNLFGGFDCIGAQCCQDGMTYDNSNNVCMLSSSESSTKESFTLLEDVHGDYLSLSVPVQTDAVLLKPPSFDKVKSIALDNIDSYEAPSNYAPVIPYA